MLYMAIRVVTVIGFQRILIPISLIPSLYKNYTAAKKMQYENWHIKE